MSAELDRAVDMAHWALSRVVKLAAQEDLVDLMKFADEARSDLLDAWEVDE